MYEYSKTGIVISNFDTSYSYCRNTTAVSNILENGSYIGHACKFKFGRASYNDHRKLRLPESEHRFIENTHESLIYVNTWAPCMELRKIIWKKLWFLKSEMWLSLQESVLMNLPSLSVRNQIVLLKGNFQTLIKAEKMWKKIRRSRSDFQKALWRSWAWNNQWRAVQNAVTGLYRGTE